MRPFAYAHFGRNYARLRGWELFAYIAPYPEQTQGSWLRALVHLHMTFDTQWPFVRASIYCPRRDDKAL